MESTGPNPALPTRADGAASQGPTGVWISPRKPRDPWHRLGWCRPPVSGAILEEAEKVARLPTEGVPPMSHAVPRLNVWRGDEVGPCLTQEEALSTAPEVEQGRFKVPRIIEEAP